MLFKLRKCAQQRGADKIIYFEDIPTELRDHANKENRALIDAMRLGFEMGAKSGSSSVMSVTKRWLVYLFVCLFV